MSTYPAMSEVSAAERRRRIEYHLIFLVITGVILTLAATMSVRGEGTQVSLPFIDRPLPELCHSRRMLGIDCPGCGMTRCFISLAHGDLAAAWRFNAVGVVVFGLMLAQIPYRGWQMWRLSHAQTEWQPRGLVTGTAIGLVSLLALQWLWKLIALALG